MFCKHELPVQVWLRPFIFFCVFRLGGIGRRGRLKTYFLWSIGSSPIADMFLFFCVVRMLYRLLFNKKFNIDPFYLIAGGFFICFCLFCLSYAAVPLFKLLCQDTGPNGLYGLFSSANDALGFGFTNLVYSSVYDFFWGDLRSDLLFRKSALGIQFYFVLSNSDPSLSGLVFTVPKSLSTEIVLGEPSLFFFTVKNVSEHDIVFTSVYTAFPDFIVPFFEKIQCFCYDNQVVSPGEVLELPVYLRIDPNIVFVSNYFNTSRVDVVYTILPVADV